jgi:tetratricopeptide (TPR) repeat protein
MFPAALRGLTNVQRARGDLDGAISSSLRLVTADPIDDAAQFDLATLCLEVAQKPGRGSRTDSLLAMAEAAFAASASSSQYGSRARLGRAEIRLRRGDADGAYADAKSLLGDSTVAAASRVLAGRAALAAQRPRETVVMLAPAFQTDRLDQEGMATLGSAYLQLEMPVYAARVLGRAHERRPDDWRTTVNLAIALAQSDDLQRSEELLRELAKRHPDEPYVLQNLAAVLQRRGQRNEAAELLRRAEALRRR